MVRGCDKPSVLQRALELGLLEYFDDGSVN